MPIAPPGPRVRVLIADDTSEIRMLLRLGLELDGRFAVVGEAADGTEAVELARELKPDVAVLDLAMPRMDGLQALPQIRHGSPATRIVVLSAFSARQMAHEAYAAGADAYLEKGAAADDLVAAIGSLLGVPRERPMVDHAAGAHDGGRPPAAVDDLAAHIGHELRHPLVLLKAFVTTLHDAAARGDVEGMRRSAAAIERNTRVLDDLVSSLADAHAVDVGRLALDLEILDVAALVSELAEDLAATVADHPIVVTAGRGVLVRGDPVRLRQVVMNLVSNAAKFSAPGSPVEVAVRRAAHLVEVAVRDHGPGVPETERHRLFTKFGRLPATASVKGTGLGLYLVRGIARAHGGDVTLVDPPGGGAQFVVRLPAMAAHPLARPLLATPERDLA